MHVDVVWTDVVHRCQCRVGLVSEFNGLVVASDVEVRFEPVVDAAVAAANDASADRLAVVSELIDGRQLFATLPHGLDECVFATSDVLEMTPTGTTLADVLNGE